MLKSAIPSLIDSVDVGEVKVDLLQKSVEGYTGMTMVARYALVISSTGTRLGSGSRSIWSEETHNKLRDLLRSMEMDVCNDVFGQAPTGGSRSEDDPKADGVPEL